MIDFFKKFKKLTCKYRQHSYNELKKRRLLYYASWANLEKKYLYIETPKVACTKIKRILQEVEGLEISKRVWASIHTRDNKNVTYVKRLGDYSIEEQNYLLKSPDVFRFCFVRNPYNRLFSAYNNKIYNNDIEYLKIQNGIRKKCFVLDDKISFIDFIFYVIKQDIAEQDIHWRIQAELIFYDEINYSFIGKLESFDNDFKYVLEKLNVEEKLFYIIEEKINKTERLIVGPKYNHELADLVYKKYFKDFKCFGYSKKSWF